MTKEAKIESLKYAIREANYFLASVCTGCNEKGLSELKHIIEKRIYDNAMELQEYDIYYDFETKTI